MAIHILRTWGSRCCEFTEIEAFDDESKTIVYYKIPIVEEKDRVFIAPN